MKKSEWWKHFFSGLAVELWRHAVTPEQTQAEADFITKMLRLEPSAKILDVPCGDGRLAIGLAKKGFHLTGVDLSMPFLRQAKLSAPEIGWEHHDMRELPWRNRFDGAFCFGNSFGYLDDKGQQEFLRAVYRILRPGARFVLDAPSVAENILPQIQEHTEMQIHDILFIEDNHYDPVLSRLETKYTFVRGDRTEKKFGSHRLYTYRELLNLLSDAGFVNIKSFGSIDREPFKLGSKGLYFVAEKKKSKG
jgi:SAM-dependent methyltransferase